MSSRTVPPRDALPRKRGDPQREELPASGVKNRRLILAAAGVLLVVVVLTWLIAFSSVFGVKTVTVKGVHSLTAGQVRAAAGIAEGTPLVRLDKAGVLRRVEALPQVASAELSTSFPSTVVITVTERVAIGYVKKGSAFELVGANGEQFRSVRSRPANLPLFVVPSGADSRTTGGAVATVAAALPASIRAKVDSIQALDPRAISLLLTDGRVVQWGSPARSQDKARILPTLLKQPGTQFDLTDPDQPFSR